MRIRQFLALERPMIVQQDGRQAVLLAFVVSLTGSPGAMLCEPTIASSPRFVPLSRVTFPPALVVGPSQRVGQAELGSDPISIGGTNRAQRRAAGKREN